MKRFLFATLFMFAVTRFAAPGRVSAQDVPAPPTNIEMYQRMALDCLGALPDGTQAIALDAAPAMPFIRSALLNHWTQAGRRVYEADSALALPPALPRLQYTISSAGVSYARLRRRSMQRTVRFATHRVLTDPGGVILDDTTCERQKVDSLRIADLKQIESGSYPETQAAPPKSSWSRRILEPLVLTAATVVSVYLFFTLRSDNADTDA